MTADDYSSDAELGEGLRSGEPWAGEVFLERFLPVVTRRLRRYMGGDDAHEHPDLADSASRVVARVARKMTGPDPVSNLTSYVLTAADNEGRDWYAKQKRLPQLTDVDNVSERDLDAALRADEDDAHDGEVLDRLPGARAVFEEALGKLRDPEREVLLLRARGLDYAEINRILGDPKKPVTDNAWVKRATRAEDRLTEEVLRLTAGKPQLEHAIKVENARRKAARKKSKRKNAGKKEGAT